MKVVAFNCSPDRTEIPPLPWVLVLANWNAGRRDAAYPSGRQALRGCSGCQVCRQRQDHLCALPDDGLNGYIRAMLEADGILLGSPSISAA
jgi:hypothetical protein